MPSDHSAALPDRPSLPDQSALHKALRAGPAGVDARRQPAFRTGRRHEVGWAATCLCPPFAAFLTGHTLVLDGGNHLRRDFVMPPVTPIPEQLPPRG